MSASSVVGGSTIEPREKGDALVARNGSRVGGGHRASQEIGRDEALPIPHFFERSERPEAGVVADGVTSGAAALNDRGDVACEARGDALGSGVAIGAIL